MKYLKTALCLFLISLFSLCCIPTANAAGEAHVPNATAEELPIQPEFAPNFDYDMWTVVDYTIEDIMADLVCTISTNEAMDEFYLECNIYGDDQMTLTAVEDGAYINKADKTGFMAGDTPAILEKAIAQNLWVPMSDYRMPPEIAVDEIDFPDSNFRGYVAEHCDIDRNGSLSADEIKAVTDMDVSSCGITDLTGIKYFTALTDLTCRNNQLTKLELSANTALRRLYCENNRLTSLDISANTLLSELYCCGNQLTSLNVTSNTVLSDLVCYNNQLTSLNVSANAFLRYLDCYNNQLSRLDISSCTFLWYIHCGNNQLTSLDVSANTALTYLICFGNQLTSLDVSTCTELLDLSCDRNQLTNLDVAANKALSSLDCRDNQLTNLDVSANPELEQLRCGENKLMSLDITVNTALRSLDCGGNQLAFLDVSNNPALKSLTCQNNQLKSLDVTANTELLYFDCHGNQLRYLDVSNHSALDYLNCSDNQLTRLELCADSNLLDGQCYFSGQTTSAEMPFTDGIYRLDFAEIVGSENTDRVVITSVTPQKTQYSFKNGVLTAKTALKRLVYTYAHGGSDDGAMAVTVNLITNVKPGLDVWHTVEELPTEPEFDPNPDYDMWTVVEYTIEDIQADLVCTVSATADLSEFYLECNFYGDDQMTLTVVEDGEYVNKADKTGFMAGDTPAILDIAIAQNLWVPMNDETYLISYNANGGNGAPSAQIRTNGQTTTLSAKQPTREGWYFLGWAESEDAAEAVYYPGGSISRDANTTLYAVWAKPDFVLPATLTRIEEEAFAGGAFRFVKLPDNAVSIAHSAFADCPKLACIYIPDKVTDIHQDAFGSTTALTIIGKSGSKAETFARTHGYAFLEG